MLIFLISVLQPAKLCFIGFWVDQFVECACVANGGKPFSQPCAGGQKVKVVLAAAMWNCPHLLVLVRCRPPSTTKHLPYKCLCQSAIMQR